MNILDEIVATKRTEIEGSKMRYSLEEMKKAAEEARRERQSFRKLFDAGPVFIAEVKPRSPSAGKLIEHSPLDVARLYAKSAADVVSVLTDEKYFGGSIELLEQVRAIVPQALLRKDFIVDEYQIYESARSGADVFLLIAAILSTDELKGFRELGQSLGLETLVEVHDGRDLEKALDAGAEVVGINNRDLTHMQTDLSTTEHLMRHIPPAIPVVSESGIREVADVMRMRACGVRGILVGTSILRAANPTAKITELKQALHE